MGGGKWKVKKKNKSKKKNGRWPLENIFMVEALKFGAEGGKFLKKSDISLKWEKIEVF